LKLNSEKVNQIKNNDEGQSNSKKITKEKTNSLENSPVMKILFNNKENVRSNDNDELKIILDLIKNTNEQTKLKINSKDNIVVGQQHLPNDEFNKKSTISKSLSKKSLPNDSLTKEDLIKFKDNEIKELMKQMNEIKSKLSTVIEQKNEQKTSSEAVLLKNHQDKTRSKRKHRTKKKQTTKLKSKGKKDEKDNKIQESESVSKNSTMTDIFKL